eukprot:Skav224828  [mRNA]  locus=scaffold3408:59265:68916:+ [translate_table: standard]
MCQFWSRGQDLSSGDKKKLHDAIQHLEAGCEFQPIASSPSDALRIQAAEKMMIAPSNPGYQSAAIVAVLKEPLRGVVSPRSQEFGGQMGMNADERNEICQEIQNKEASGDKDALQSKVEDLMAAPPHRRAMHFAVAAAMQGLNADDRSKIRGGMQHLEAPAALPQLGSQASSEKDALRIKAAEMMMGISADERKKIQDDLQNKEDSLAAMAADLLMADAEDGKFDNRVEDAIEDERFHVLGGTLRYLRTRS